MRTPTLRAVRSRVTAANDRQRVARYVRQAASMGLELHVHPQATIGERLVLQVRGDKPSRLTIGAGSYLEDDCTVRMKGGEITIGENTFIRRFMCFNVEGSLAIGDEVAIGWSCAIHAAERVEMHKWSGISERVSITDSRHLMDDPDRWFYHQSTSAPTVIGHNSWVATNSVVTMGVTIGRNTIIAANSTVLSDIGDGVIAAGSPARVVGTSAKKAD